MRRFLGAALSGAILSAPIAASHAQAVDATIDRAVAAWSKVKTLRGGFEQTITNPITGSAVSSKGTYAQEKPNKLSIRFAAPASDAIVSDGKYLWVYLPTSAPGQVIRRPATERGAVPIDVTGQFLDAPKSKYAISAADTKTVDGHPTHALQLVAKPNAGAPVAKATVWVDDDDSIIREFESLDANGVTRHVKLTSIELNGAVDQSLFTFAPPAGVKVLDRLP